MTIALPRSRERLQVLVADDNGEIHRLLRYSFEGLGYAISQAFDGMGALEIARREKPDVVLMDIMMPGAIDGLEACRRIKAEASTRGCYVILLTALGQRTDIDQGIEAGADFYITKPFSPLDLIGVIARRFQSRLAI